MSEPVLLYILCETQKQARDISESLLTKRLVACTNIIHPVTSMFRWPSNSKIIDTTTETLLLAKTVKEKWGAIEKEVTKIHSYEAPAILAIPLMHVSKKYLTWLTGELI